MAKSKSKSVKSLIKNLEPDELREVIQELCKLNPKNRHFVQLYIQGSGEVNLDEVTEEARKKVYNHLYGRSMFPKIDLGNARKAVNEYAKVLKEYPERVADLKLYYVEVGTEITSEFGDMDEKFYSSMESMFKNVCKIIRTHPHFYERLRDRIPRLKSASSHIGYGYGDVINDMAYELEGDVENG